MNFIRTKGKISPKVTRARGSINPRKAEADGASSVDVPGLGVSRKKIMAVKKGEEQNSVTGEPLPRNKPRLFFIVGFWERRRRSMRRNMDNRRQEGAKSCAWEKCDLSFLRKRKCKFRRGSKHRLGAEWVCRCKNSNCASHQTLAPFHTTPKTNRFYDINRELVLGLRLIGRGYSAATKVLSVLNLPRPVSNVSWTAHTKAIELAANELLERELQNAVLQVKRYKLENGDLDANVDSSIADEQLKDIVVDAGVSIDGSWNSRGWSARDGMVAVVSHRYRESSGCRFSVQFMCCLWAKEKRTTGGENFKEGFPWVVHWPRRELLPQSRREFSGLHFIVYLVQAYLCFIYLFL